MYKPQLEVYDWLMHSEITFRGKLCKRIEKLEADAAKNNERIAFLEEELEERIKLAERFYTAKSD